MRIVAALKGSLKEVVAAENRAATRAVTGGVRETTEALKQRLRRQVTASGLGEKLARTWQGKTYPAAPSIGAAGWIYSKAPEIITGHRGAVIRSGKGLWLAIPAPAAPRIGGRRPTPQAVETAYGRTLRMILRPGKAGLLVLDGVRLGPKSRRPRAIRERTRKDGSTQTLVWATSLRGSASVVMFFLVPRTRLRKRLDVDAAADWARGALPAAVIRHWRPS